VVDGNEYLSKRKKLVSLYHRLVYHMQDIVTCLQFTDTEDLAVLQTVSEVTRKIHTLLESTADTLHTESDTIALQIKEVQ
jgi:hypothetical protein